MDGGRDNSTRNKKGVRRPMNAFLIFCKWHRSKEREKNPDMDNRSITRILGDMWAKLEPERKKHFTNMAKEKREAFLKANPNYKWHAADKSDKSQGGSNKSSTASSACKSPTDAMESQIALGKSSGQDFSTESRKQKSLCPAQLPSSSSTAPAPSLESSMSGKDVLSISLEGGADGSQESNSALLQLAEMCTSELYSSGPDEASKPTSNKRACTSSPMPPPKKRARQWSLDHSQETAERVADTKNAIKPATNGKKSEALSSSKKQNSKNTPKQKQSKASKLDKKQKNSIKSSTPLSSGNPTSAAGLSFPAGSNISQSGSTVTVQSSSSPNNVITTSQVGQVKDDQRQLGHQPLPPPPLPPAPPSHGPSLFPRWPPLDRQGSIAQSSLFPTAGQHHGNAGRDSPEKGLDLRSTSSSRNSPKLMEALSSDFIPERRFNSFSSPLMISGDGSKGKIASLLSSPHLLNARAESDIKPPLSSSHLTPALSNPVSTSQLPPASSLGCISVPPPFSSTPKGGSLSLVGTAGATTATTPTTIQPATEGNLKKKWMQRMLVEAKEEADQQALLRMAPACVTDRICLPQSSMPSDSVRHDLTLPHPKVSVKLEDDERFGNGQIPPLSLPAQSNNNGQFLFSVKPELKVEPQSLFSSNSDLKPDASQRPRDYSLQNLSAANNNSLPVIVDKGVKLENSPLHSNTLYRALMGHTPTSQFGASIYPVSSQNLQPPLAPRSIGQMSDLPPTTKGEMEDKKVFTPIAACGKKIMDHIVERLFQSGFSGDGRDSDSAQRMGGMADAMRSQNSGDLLLQTPSSTSAPLPVPPRVPPPPLSLPQHRHNVNFSPAMDKQMKPCPLSPDSLVEQVVKKMFQDQTVDNCAKTPIQSETKNSSHHGSHCCSPNLTDRDQQNHPPIGISKTDKPYEDFVSSKVPLNQHRLMSESLDDGASPTESAEEAVFQPVRKSRRANRGQKYQALIKEGIIQPSKERLAARNAERNVKSCSSKEDVDRCEQPKKLLKRLYSEREPSSHLPASGESHISDAKDNNGVDAAKPFDLEKEISSLPPCSYDQFEKKRLTSCRPSYAEADTAKSNVAGGDTSTQGSKASTASVEPLKKETSKEKLSYRTPGGKAATCHASLKELGCHTVHIPLIKEEQRPAESLTGSQKRKARRHCITRISVAPLKGEIGKADKSSILEPALDSASKESSNANSYGDDDRQRLGNTGEGSVTKNHRGLALSDKTRIGSEATRDFLASRQASMDFSPQPFVSSARSVVTPGGPGTSASRGLSQHDFPALTLLSSVMIDSEKAIFPATRQGEGPSTTQSPIPASLARPWPLGLDAAHAATYSTAKKPTASPSPPHLPMSTPTPSSVVLSESATLAKLMTASGFPTFRQTLPGANRSSSFFPPSSSSPSSLLSPHTSVAMTTTPSTENCAPLPSPNSWPVMMASSSSQSSPVITPTASAIVRSSANLLSPALHQLPVTSMMPGSAPFTANPASSATQPTNSFATGMPTAAAKRLATPVVPSAYIISTLTPSKTTDMSKSSPSPVNNNNTKHTPPAVPGQKKKKPGKGNGANNDKRKPEAVNPLPTSSPQETLNPATKKLVKLLLKDNESAVESTIATRPQPGFEAKTAVMSQTQLPDPCKQEAVVTPTLAANHHQNKNIVPQPSRKRPIAKSTSKVVTSPTAPIAKADQQVAFSSAQRMPPPSSNFLSSRTQQEVGQFASTVAAANSAVDKQTQPPATKKHKPTIWDHLNSPGFLPMNSNALKNVPPASNQAPLLPLLHPAKKKGQRQQTNSNRSAAQVCPTATSTTSKPAAAATKSKSSLSKRPQIQKCEKAGSDTESASEDNEDRACSDTDSAEESPEMAPSRASVVNNLQPRQQTSLATMPQAASTALFAVPKSSPYQHNLPNSIPRPSSAIAIAKSPMVTCKPSNPASPLKAALVSSHQVPNKKSGVLSPSLPGSHQSSSSHTAVIAKAKGQGQISQPQSDGQSDRSNTLELEGPHSLPSAPPCSPQSQVPMTAAASPLSLALASQCHATVSVSLGSSPSTVHPESQSIPSSSFLPLGVRHLFVPPMDSTRSSSNKALDTPNPGIPLSIATDTDSNGNKTTAAEIPSKPPSSSTAEILSKLTAAEVPYSMPSSVTKQGATLITSVAPLPPPPRVPLSSATAAAIVEPVKYEGKAVPVPLLELEGGATAHVGNSPCLPGSPSMAIVQS